MVTEHNLHRRIDRQLAKHGERLRRVSPRSKWHDDLGPYYIENDTDWVVAYGITDLAPLAKECGVLA